MKKQEVLFEILEYLKAGNPLIAELNDIPLDASLVELGYLDSYGIVDLIIFLESKYAISITDQDITKEKFGSINKIVTTVLQKSSS